MSTWYDAANKALSENNLIECVNIINYAAKKNPESLIVSSSTLKMLKLKLYSMNTSKAVKNFIMLTKSKRNRSAKGYK